MRGFVLALMVGLVSSVYALDASPPGVQPATERKAQESLPMSHHPIWNVLAPAKVSYSNTPPHITISLTAPIRALSGTVVSATGFVLPMDDGAETLKTKHFLLSKRTPTCFYCPPGEPNEVIEVFLDKTISWNDRMVGVEGPMGLINNTDNGIFFRVKGARVVSATL